MTNEEYLKLAQLELYVLQLDEMAEKARAEGDEERLRFLSVEKIDARRSQHQFRLRGKARAEMRH